MTTLANQEISDTPLEQMPEAEVERIRQLLKERAAHPITEDVAPRCYSGQADKKKFLGPE